MVNPSGLSEVLHVMTNIPNGQFGPIFASAILDGTGKATVSFQVNGNNARITRLYVSVSSSVKQASVTIYKGQVATSSALGTIISGSTGGLASGQIDITDGQTVYVVWTGGDAGATATAVFGGMAIPLSDVGNDSITWSDPIAAADGTLVFPAIKSVNYSAGVSGWLLDRNGNIEANNGTFRGTLNAGNGSVIVDSTGVHVIGPAHRWDINTSVGFVSTRIPDDGTLGLIFDAGFFMRGTTPTPNGFNTTGDGVIFASTNTTGLDDAPYVNVISPTLSGKPGTASVFMQSQSGLSATDNSIVVIQGNALQVNNTANILNALLVRNVDIGCGVFAHDLLTASSGTIGATETIVMSALQTGGFSQNYRAGRAYCAEFSGSFTSSVATTDVLMRVRKNDGSSPPTGQQLSVGRFSARVAATSYDGSWKCYFQGSSTATSTVVVLTLTGSAANNATISASATSPAHFQIYDVGSATDYPGIPTLV
jgi:hypothetical protein